MESKTDLKTDTTIYPNLNPPVNIYFVFHLGPGTPDTTITLANSLHGMISFTKNGTDPNEYTYSGYGVSFSSKKYAHADGENAYDLISLVQICLIQHTLKMQKIIY